MYNYVEVITVNGKNDAMNRKEITNNVCSLIKSSFSERESSFIMIDGEWGSGKSFVLDMIEEQLKEIYEDKRHVIIIKYNCWEDSYYDDPLSAILSILFDEFDKRLTNWNGENKEKFNKLIKGALTLLSAGGGLFSMPKEVFEALFDGGKVETLTEQVKQIRNFLKYDFKEYQFIFLVDELDRCLPEYAIKTLERLYLLFKDVSNFIVVICNNNNQLKHSIQNIFGKETDYKKYIDKFINYYFTLEYDVLNLKSFIANNSFYFSEFENRGFFEVEEKSNIIYYILIKLTARERENMIKICKAIDNMIEDDRKKGPSYCFAEMAIVFYGIDGIFEIIYKDFCEEPTALIGYDEQIILKYLINLYGVQENTVEIDLLHFCCMLVYLLECNKKDFKTFKVNNEFISKERYCEVVNKYVIYCTTKLQEYDFQWIPLLLEKYNIIKNK